MFRNRVNQQYVVATVKEVSPYLSRSEKCLIGTDGQPLSQDDFVIVYHATSKENAESLLKNGFRIGQKRPQPLPVANTPELANMLRVKVGEPAPYGIGHGKGKGIYFSLSPAKLYGNSWVSFPIQVKDLKNPPERAGCSSPEWALLLDDGYAEINIPASRFVNHKIAATGWHLPGQPLPRPLQPTEQEPRKSNNLSGPGGGPVTPMSEIEFDHNMPASPTHQRLKDLPPGRRGPLEGPAHSAASIPLSDVVQVLKDEDNTEDASFVSSLVRLARKYKQWELKSLDPKQLILEPINEKSIEGLDRDTLSECQPIVAIPGEGGLYQILDGNHRANAAYNFGIKIKAYVPKITVTAETVGLDELVTKETANLLDILRKNGISHFKPTIKIKTLKQDALALYRGGSALRSPIFWVNATFLDYCDEYGIDDPETPLLDTLLHEMWHAMADLIRFRCRYAGEETKNICPDETDRGRGEEDAAELAISLLRKGTIRNYDMGRAFFEALAWDMKKRRITAASSDTRRGGFGPPPLGLIEGPMMNDHIDDNRRKIKIVRPTEEDMPSFPKAIEPEPASGEDEAEEPKEEIMSSFLKKIERDVVTAAKEIHIEDVKKRVKFLLPTLVQKKLAPPTWTWKPTKERDDDADPLIDEIKSKLGMYYPHLKWSLRSVDGATVTEMDLDDGGVIDFAINLMANDIFTMIYTPPKPGVIEEETGDEDEEVQSSYLQRVASAASSESSTCVCSDNTRGRTTLLTTLDEIGWWPGTANASRSCKKTIDTEKIGAKQLALRHIPQAEILKNLKANKKRIN